VLRRTLHIELAQVHQSKGDMMSEVTNLREDIKKDGYSPVVIDLAGDDLADAMKKYMAFLQLDEQHHDSTRFCLTDRGDDYGQYTRIAGSESDRGTVPDNKDIFHFGAQTRQVVESRLRGNVPQAMSEFLAAAEHIYWAALRSKNRALEDLYHWQMGITDIMSPELSHLNDVLRFIAYYPNPGNLAKGHFDRGVSTLAIGESHAGLRLAAGQNGAEFDCSEQYMHKLELSLKPVNHEFHEAKFFLGAGWNRLPHQYRLGNTELPLGYHDVIANEESVDDVVKRWEIVMFSNPHIGFEGYTVPTPPETRPYKQLGKITTESLIAA
jgi:hypothetical protein